jgi:hypothetical protein
MPFWPFGRKKRRISIGTNTTATTTTMGTATTTTTTITTVPTAVSDPSPRFALPTPENSKLLLAEGPGAPESSDTLVLKRHGSVEADLTALPAFSELAQSPHLRPANGLDPVHPYNLDRSTSARTSRVPTVILSPLHEKSSTHCRRQSNKRKKDQTLREEDIRQMSAPMQIPKRPAANSGQDLLRRDSKKARRTLSKRPDDSRSSNVSIPMPDSIHRNMAAMSEQRAWAIGSMSMWSPRPTVRVSGTFTHTPPQRPRNMGKLPEVAPSTNGRKDQRKVAELANDLNSSELRLLMERDSRRKEKKALEQHERLDRKLRRRAETQRLDEEGRTRNSPRHNATPPTDIHPAFRAHQPDASPTPLTPISLKKLGKQPITQESPTNGGTYLLYPPREDIPQNPFADPELESESEVENPFTSAGAEYSPVQTSFDEPVLQTARAVRLSAGHLSPPASPSPNIQRDLQPSPSLAEVSYPISTRTSSHPASSFESSRHRPSESGSRRTGPSAWTTLFRRGMGSTRASEDKSPSEFSFVNTSRESMSKQLIPAHLIASKPSRSSGVPVRTQSKFREDLPESPIADLPISPPSSRVQSPELSVIAAGVAAARRGQRNVERSITTESPDLIRNDSPAIPEYVESTALSQSFGSVDSEGSWISGRLVKQPSHASHLQSSLGSFKKGQDDFSNSFDHLPVPEHEYFASLTPEIGSRRASVEHKTEITATVKPILGEAGPLRQATARRRPTVVHNDPRFRSREGLLTEYHAGEATEVFAPSREGSLSGESDEETSHVEIHKAERVSYGKTQGHARSLSAGSGRMLDIPPIRRTSVGTKLTDPSPDV